MLHSTQILPIFPVCEAVPKELRFECGWRGITEQQCLNRKCCYDESPGHKWCFQPEGNVLNKLQ